MVNKCIKKSSNILFTSTDDPELYFISTDNLKILVETFSFWFIGKAILAPYCSKLVLYTTSTI